MLSKKKIEYEKQSLPTPAGRMYLNTYTLSTLEGRETLTKTGETNVYEKIQKDLEESKIENIIKRVMMGDLTALRAGDPQYIDSSTIPNNLMQVQNTIVRMKEEFLKMPEEVRRMFNYSAEQYVNEMGTKEYLEKMSPYIEKIEKISKEKNAKEYEKKVREGAKLNYDIEKEKMRLSGSEGGNAE